MSVELKACPFDGMRALAATQNRETGIWWVSCTRCDAELSGVTKAEVIEAWNRRVSAAPSEGGEKGSDGGDGQAGAKTAACQPESPASTAQVASLAKFARTMLRALWEGSDPDGGDIQDIAEKLGLICNVGFDPARHTDHYGVGLEVGDEWYEEQPWLVALGRSTPTTQEADHAE